MKNRALKSIVYLLLTVGAITMVFPFIWMLVTSFKSSLEVLSAQITLVPKLKKYVVTSSELEQVEFSLALKLENTVSLYEGRILDRVAGKEYLQAEFGSDVSNYFGRCREDLEELFARFHPRAEVESEIERIWLETLGKIPSLPSAEKLPAKLKAQLLDELTGLRLALEEITAQAIYDEKDLEVVVLAGEQRGEVYTVPLTDLVWKRFLWSNYRKAWEAAPFARYFINSIFMATAVTICQVLTSALAAYAFARMNFKFKETLFMVLLGTMMIPKQVILIPDYAIISHLHWMNTYYALIVPFVAAVFGIYFMRQHFETLPQDLFDAASIDGCNRFRMLFQIILPISRGVIITVSLFTFIMTWNSLLWPLVMTNTPEMRPLQVGLAVFNQESGTDWELLMAASTFSVLPLLLLFFVAQKQFVEGITRSGMKG